MFLGTHRPRLDEKGRLALPAKFRDELPEGVVITKGQERCLYGFPLSEFQAIGDKLRTQPLSAKALREFNDHVHHDERVDLSMIPIGEGLTLLRRRG